MIYCISLTEQVADFEKIFPIMKRLFPMYIELGNWYALGGIISVFPMYKYGS